MNEGLTIQLSVAGVQSAMGNIADFKKTIDSLSGTINQLSSVGKFGAITQAAKAGFELGESLKNLPAQVNDFYTSIQRGMSGGLGFIDAFTNYYNKKDITDQKSLNIRTLELKNMVEMGLVQNHIEEQRVLFSQKKITAEELYNEVFKKRVKLIELEEQPLQAKKEEIQKKLSLINDLDLEGTQKRIKLTTELLEIESRLKMLGVKASGQEQAALAEKFQNIKEANAILLRNELENEMNLLKLKEKQFNLVQTKVTSDFRLTEIEKSKRLLALYQQEGNIVKEQILNLKKLKEEQAKLDPKNTQAQEVIQSRIDNVERRGVGIDQQTAAIESKADPNSMAQQLQATATQLSDEFGTMAIQMANTFRTVFETAISSISSGISGLILGTQTWAQALANIGNSILTSIVSSIVQMGVRWVATQLMMAAFGRAIAGTVTASLIPIAAAQSVILAAPATLATIASFGGAAGAAPGQVALSIAASKALALTGFGIGGYTGDGPSGSIAGIVHRGEYVLPAPVVDRVGISALDSMAQMGSGGEGQNIAFFDDGSKLSDWARTQAGETIIVDVVRRNLHQFGKA